jgi:hypothetical protein
MPAPSEPPPHIESAERFLKERGHTLGSVRVAVGRSGIALGFPENPMLHVSWWALGALLVVLRVLRRR